MNEIEQKLALAIGHALNYTLVELVPSRPNIGGLNNVSDSNLVALEYDARELLRNNIRKLPPKNSPKRNCNYPVACLETMAKRALQLGIGYCGELISIAMTFLGIYHVSLPANIHIQQLFISEFIGNIRSQYRHIFAIVHNNNNLYKRVEDYQLRGDTNLRPLTDSFYTLFSFNEPFIILDPWIREVCLNTKVEDLVRHKNTAATYHVSQYYADLPDSANNLKLRYTIPIRFHETDSVNLSTYHMNKPGATTKYREHFRPFWEMFKHYYIQQLQYYGLPVPPELLPYLPPSGPFVPSDPM